MTTQQIVQIIQALIQNVIWPLALFLLPWLFGKVISHLPIVRQIIITGIVKHGVQMVMQKFGNLTPEEKKKKAEDAIYTLASFFGITLDPAVVNTILESIVWETKQSQVVETTLTTSPLPAVEKPKLA
jgi:hypothetical protein